MLEINQKSVVEKVYITRGDNVFDHNGIKCDKAYGLVIEGKIHWIDQSFATLDELSSKLYGFGVSASGMAWGVIDEAGRAVLEHRMTKIGKHQDDIFDSKSFYMKSSKRKACGSVWWTPAEIKKTYLSAKAAA